MYKVCENTFSFLLDEYLEVQLQDLMVRASFYKKHRIFLSE